MLPNKTYFVSKVFLNLILFSILLNTTGFTQNISDSLTFIHAQSDQKVLLTQGMLLEIKTNDNQKLVGEFNGGSSTELYLKQKNNNQKLALSAIKKITAYKEGSKDPITGTVRFVVSASSATSMILGAGAMAGGIATVSNNKALGIGLIGISIPLIYYGIKLHFMLKNADRDVIKMNKGWTIASSNQK